MNWFPKVIAFAAVGTCLAVISASAAAATFSIEADETLAHSGGGIYSWPGQDMASDVRPSEPSPAVIISGEIEEDGTLSLDPEDFAVQPSWVIVSGDMFVGPFPRIDWRAVGPVNGTYSEASGETSISLNLVQTVSVPGTPSCEVGPVPVTLSTEYASDIRSGRRFTEGLDGPGALVGGWADVPTPSGEGCDLRSLGCLVRQHLLAGPGSFGLAREYSLDGTVPWQQDKTIDKFDLGGFVREGGCEPDPVDPGPGPQPDPDPRDPDLSVKVWRTAVGSRQATFKAKATNAGGPASGVTLCGKALRGPRLRPRGCHAVGTMAEGVSVTRRLTVGLSSNRAKRRRQLNRGRLTVTLAADGQAPETLTRRIRGPVPVTPGPKR